MARYTPPVRDFDGKPYLPTLISRRAGPVGPAVRSASERESKQFFLTDPTPMEGGKAGKSKGSKRLGDITGSPPPLPGAVLSPYAVPLSGGSPSFASPTTSSSSKRLGGGKSFKTAGLRVLTRRALAGLGGGG